MNFVFVGPSGAGKNTLIKELVAHDRNLRFSVSCTTRPPRGGEREGVDYYFLDPIKFKQMIAQNHFLEWAEVHGYLYGTPKGEVAKAAMSHKDLLMDVDCEGARQMRQNFDFLAYFVFILPPSRQAVERRLRDRNRESEEDLELRLKNATLEVGQAELCNAWIVNDSLERTVRALQGLISLRRMRVSPRDLEYRNPTVLNRVLSTFTAQPASH